MVNANPISAWCNKIFLCTFLGIRFCFLSNLTGKLSKFSYSPELERNPESRTLMWGNFSNKFLPSLRFPFHLLPSPVHSTGFSFGFLATLILLPSRTNSKKQFISWIYTYIYIVMFTMTNWILKFAGFFEFIYTRKYMYRHKILYKGLLDILFIGYVYVYTCKNIFISWMIEYIYINFVRILVLFSFSFRYKY